MLRDTRIGTGTFTGPDVPPTLGSRFTNFDRSGTFVYSDFSFVDLEERFCPIKRGYIGEVDDFSDSSGVAEGFRID